VLIGAEPIAVHAAWEPQACHVDGVIVAFGAEVGWLMADPPA
jgi:hypothetical protein